MRLLTCDDHGKIRLEGPFEPPDIPPYAILSHTWGDQEVLFQDMRDGTGRSKQGYLKIELCVQQAKRDGLDYSWVDTCCIDKSSSAELTEAITSMFRWYSSAERCYVFMSDVPSDADDRSFQKSRWFTRGWTLQELLAPRSVEFFDRNWNLIGNKSDPDIDAAIRQITKIPPQALSGTANLSEFSVEERIGWLGARKTKREEDEAYCLVGILGISMSIIYGEGRERAMTRLRDEANKRQRAHIGTGNRTLSWLFGPEPLLPKAAISGSAPCFVEFEGNLVAMWRARDDPFLWVPLPFTKDYTLWWTTLWRNQQGTIIPGYPKQVHWDIQSSERPAVAVMRNQLVAAWKGVNHDSLYYSTFRHDTDEWAKPAPIPHAASSTGLSLGSLEPSGSKSVYALWRGNDNHLYLSTYDGACWKPPKTLPRAKTDVNPTLAAYEGKLIIAWKEFRSQRLYWMFFDTEGDCLMERPHAIDWEHGISNLGPTLAVVDGTLFAAWKGTVEPDNVQLSTWQKNNGGFADVQIVPNSNTRCAPTLASWGERLVLAWRGDDWERTMWWRNGELRDAIGDKTGEASS